MNMWTHAFLLSCLVLFNLTPLALAADDKELKPLKELPALKEMGGGANVASSFSGNISWYGKQFHGRKTASGEVFNMYRCTSAHRSLPFFTKVLVEDPRTGNTVLVKVTDRGPFVKNRVMDVSMAAARQLGTINQGMAFVDCMVLKDTRQISQR